MPVDRFLIGDTVKVTWVNSGVTPTAIHASLYDGAETLINSTTMTSSGNGHYYARVTLPNTAGHYVAQTLATVDAYPYKRRVRLLAAAEDID